MIAETNLIQWYVDFFYVPLVNGLSGPRFIGMLENNKEHVKEIIGRSIGRMKKRAQAHFKEEVVIKDQHEFVKDMLKEMEKRFLKKEKEVEKI